MQEIAINKIGVNLLLKAINNISDRKIPRIRQAKKVLLKELEILSQMNIKKSSIGIIGKLNGYGIF